MFLHTENQMLESEVERLNDVVEARDNTIDDMKEVIEDLKSQLGSLQSEAATLGQDVDLLIASLKALLPLADLYLEEFIPDNPDEVTWEARNREHLCKAVALLTGRFEVPATDL